MTAISVIETTSYTYVAIFIFIFTSTARIKIDEECNPIRKVSNPTQVEVKAYSIIYNE